LLVSPSQPAFTDGEQGFDSEAFDVVFDALDAAGQQLDQEVLTMIPGHMMEPTRHSDDNAPTVKPLLVASNPPRCGRIADPVTHAAISVSD
jgi:hypothetical protein